MFCKYKDIAVQSLSFLGMESGVIPRILLWKSMQGRNPTKVLQQIKTSYSRHFNFFEISRFLVNEKGTENIEKKFRKGS